MKITGLQIFWIMITFLTGNTTLVTVQPTILYAKQDAWISFLIAGILAILIVLLANKVALLYPGQTLIEYSKLILGKWLGTIVVIVYLIQWYSVIGNILSEFAEFANTILLPNTPSWVFILTMLLLMVYLAFVGQLEGIGRCSEVFGPIVFGSYLLLIFISIPNMDLDRLVPVYADTGLVPIVKGSLYPLSLFGESVFMLMLLSFSDHQKQGSIRAVWGVTLTVLIVCLAAVNVLMVFGPEIAGKMKYPAFDTVRYVNIMNFIQNLEIVAVLVWILSMFIKVSLYFFLAGYGTAQLFKMKDWRKTIWFVVAVSFAFTLFLTHFSLQGKEYVEVYWLPYVLPFNMIGIPLILLVMGSLRKKMSTGKTQNSNS